MNKSLKNIFYLQIFLFFIIVFTISIITLYVLERKNLEDALVVSFNHELRLASNEINFQIKMNEENVKAISSRTMIRNELYKWYNNEISLNDIRTYTNSKYIDGASVYENVLFAIRYDNSNNIIAAYNEHLMEPSPAPEKAMKMITRGNDYYICLKNDIISDGINIGFDYTAFKINNFKDKTYQNLKNLNLIDLVKENTNIKSYARSIEIGETGIFLYAELNQKVISETIKKNIKVIFFHGTLLFLLLIAVSYLTILNSIKQLMKELDEKNKQIFLQEKEMALGQVIGGIAHNLNNIIMGISGSSELLSFEKNTSEKSKKLLNIIEDRSLEAASIIKQLLDFNHQSYIMFSDENVITLLKKIVHRNQYKKHISIIFGEKISEKEYFMNTDENHMRLIIENLVKNAIEANCSNIIISADISNGQKDSLCQVCFLPVEGEWICVSVKDDGDGILSDVRFDKVFEPFFTMKGVGYAGLGLSQVSGIVKQHKGHIVIQRNPDRGMTFNIYFPI